MITAHLPAGYLLGRASAVRGRVMAAALIGSGLPDLDMFWFVDQGRVHHHAYWTHVPLFWAVVAAVTLPLTALIRRTWLPVALMFFAAILLHLLRDTIAGGIMWVWPFNDHLFVLHEVRPTQSHWVLSFMTDWTFGLEVLVWAAAIGLFISHRKSA